jgi:hypothetical protein
MLNDLKNKYFDDYQVIYNQMLQILDSLKISKEKLNNSKISVSKLKNEIEELEIKLIDNKASFDEAENIKIDSTRRREISSVEFNKEDGVHKKNEIDLISLKEDFEKKSKRYNDEIIEIEMKINKLEELVISIFNHLYIYFRYFN